MALKPHGGSHPAAWPHPTYPPPIPNIAQPRKPPPIPTSASSTKYPQPRFLSASLSLALTISLGILAKRLLEQGPEPVLRLPSLLLFTPMPLCVMLLAWTVRWNLRLIVGVTLAICVAFAGWNAILLRGLDSATLQYALNGNAQHWLLFATSGIVTGRYLQWSFGLVIVDRNKTSPARELTTTGTDHRTAKEQARGVQESDSKPTDADRTCRPPNPLRNGMSFDSPAPLSILKLLLLIVLIAFLLGLYIRMLSHDLDPSKTSFERPWYKLFPSSMQTPVSGILGGILVPIHWTALQFALRARSYRTACIVLWLPVVACLRWWTTELYFSPPSAIMGSDALTMVTADLTSPLNSTAFQLNLPSPGISIAQLWVESLLQWCLTLTSFLWLHHDGFYVGIRPSPPPLPCSA